MTSWVEAPEGEPAAHPVSGLQVSIPLQSFPSSQSRGGLFWQAPLAEQVSVPLQTLPSEQLLPVSGVKVQPVCATQASSVQGLASSQVMGALVQPLAPLQASVVHRLASSQSSAPFSSITPLQLSSMPLQVSATGVPGVQV